MEAIHFIDKDGTFSITQPENYSYLYFPIAGENGLKSALTPNLGGDIKANQNAFLMEPVSVENLHNNRSGRNFWCHVEGLGAWSAVGASAEEESRKFTKDQDNSELTAGFMWQTVSRQSDKYQLKAKITSFVPLEHNVEIMHVELCNMGKTAQTITPTAAIPIFGRSADNIRDHRHVTALLHRIKTTDYGVTVKPTLSFDERGHRKNDLTYFVCGITGAGEKPIDFYPVTEDYIGEGGSYAHPRTVLQNKQGVPSGKCYEGKEALGGIRFSTIVLKPEESVSYTVIMGITQQEEEIEDIVLAYVKAEKVKEAQARMHDYWQSKVNVRYDTGNEQYDNLLRWVSFQPFLRRIYGCSFLPYHDYGRGGRGWRDLWQDCLSLLIMDPGDVRQMILDNYGGVRIDGTNATIIGEKQGTFLADRNGIARVWMDHGVWPFMTTKLYIDQTGDIEILKESAAYFKDEQMQRGGGLDTQWDPSYGLKQKDENGTVYEGSILEHLLLEHLCAFYEVGAHNHIRLRGADWNDAIDMAAENGESVAFTCAYAGNLRQLSELLLILEEKFGWSQVELLEEIQVLLDDNVQLYDDVTAKGELLQKYLSRCQHNISGRRTQVPIGELAANLKNKAEWMAEHIRKTEWIEKETDEGWFNSYYDNDGAPVEGYFEQGVRMMLTGQVFAIMSKTAQDSQVHKICKSADHYLYQKEIGGYRLNTDFHELKFNLGRMFGFAYGEKENGAVFSHMTVMYANALYQRRFVDEGYKALQTLADAAMNFEVSRIYPGIPEYFNGSGRGMYPYLTGAGSWYMLTVVTEVFGVRGEIGDMAICPKLCKEQFDSEGNAQIWLRFAQKEFHVTYKNPLKLSYGEYAITKATCDGQTELANLDGTALLDRKTIASLSDTVHEIEIELGRR
ncbi:MAG: cellobiose phosphorylase [Lachnospiraceae bacterium]|nr:cellobiose phosphorylase [Lachnospiraceae bacterium]